MTLTLIEKSSDLPVSVEHIKAHCRIGSPTVVAQGLVALDNVPLTVANIQAQEYTGDDLYIQGLIEAAAQLIETEANIDLRETQWVLTLSSFPGQIIIPRAPLVSIDEITYYDSADVEQTLGDDDFVILKSAYTFGRLIPATYWPSTYPRHDAVTVTFTTGSETVPAMAVQAIGLCVASWYEAREDIITGTIVAKHPNGLDRLIQQLRVDA